MSDIPQETAVAPETGLIAVSDLITYDNNPREHSAETIDRMKASITAFGFRIPVLVKHGAAGPEIIDGHLRLKAALELGMTEVPVLDASDMSDDQVQSFRIMVNQSTSWADWDETKLFAEISAIKDGELAGIASLENLTGFDTGQLSVFAGFEPDVLPEVNLNKLAETTTETVDAAQSKLDSQFDKNDVELEVICPECASVFHIKT